MSIAADAAHSAPAIAVDSQRIDKWLWFARAGKTRTLCATLVSEGKVRVNGTKIDKPAHVVRVGDTVTIAMRQRMRILEVVGFGLRRGGADVAAALFRDLTPAPIRSDDATDDSCGANGAVARREPGSGRPTKRERREMERFKFRSTS